MNPLLATLTRAPPLCGPRCMRHTVRFLWGFLLLYPVHQYYLYGDEYTQWDLLLFSGVLLFILGLRLVEQLPGRLTLTLERLRRRHVLNFAEGGEARFLSRFQREGDRWARAMGVICALAMALAFASALVQAFRWDRLLLGLAECVGAYICGNYLGRMIGYGRLGHALRRHEGKGVSIDVDPLHVDGVGGFKPVGDYYFHQAMIVSLPAFFLGVWWFLFPIWPRDYSHWQHAYLGLFPLALAVEVLAFLLPIWSFHRIMRARKEALLELADQLSAQIHALLHERMNAPAAVDGGGQAVDIEALKTRYWAYENMPTWPVDLPTWRRFRVNNLLLLIPLLADIGKRGIDWKQVTAILQSLLT
ncbi:MAG: hypothetical protein MUC79_12780 [Thiobacillaceae bacterium]|nr:hypothetical protein [Thiobacillaceae bacterium]